MSKLIVLFAALAAAVAQGSRDHRDFNTDDIASQAAVGNWDEVHRLLGDFYRQRYNLFPVHQEDYPLSVSMVPVERLKPQGPRNRVYGESQSSFVQSSSVNGKTNVQGGGQRVVNNNGVVTRENLPPQFFMMGGWK